MVHEFVFSTNTAAGGQCRRTEGLNIIGVACHKVIDILDGLYCLDELFIVGWGDYFDPLKDSIAFVPTVISWDCLVFEQLGLTGGLQ